MSTHRKLFKSNQSVILLLSGGMDSIGIWAYLIEKYHLHVYPLHIYSSYTDLQQYQAIRTYETLFKKKFPSYFHAVRYYRVEKPHFRFSKFRTNSDYHISMDLLINNLVLDAQSRRYAPLFSDWPLRISRMSSLAVEYAFELMARNKQNIYTLCFGLMPEDYELADSRLPYLKSVAHSINLAFRSNKWKIIAPIVKKGGFYLSKSDLVEFNDSLDISLSHTWSCISSSLIHCGACFNCITRKQAFKRAKVKDTTLYFRFCNKSNPLYLSIQKAAHWIQQRVKGNQQPQEIYSPHSRYHINPTISWIKENDQIRIFNKIKGHIDILEDTGSYIWIQLEKQPFTSADLLKKIRARYKTNSTSVILEINTFLSSLLHNDYIISDEK